MSDDKVITFQRGAEILREGEMGDTAFLIVEGKVEVSRKSGQGKKVLTIAGPGAFLGEMALLDPAPRAASAVALESTTCRRISPQALKNALEHAPPLIRYVLQSVIRTIRQRSGIAPAEGKKSGQGSGDPIMSVYKSDRILERISVAAGGIVFTQDSDGNTAYLVQTGSIEVSRDPGDGSIQVLRRFGPGEVFGEMALLGSGQRYATAVALVSTTLEVIRAEQFLEMLNQAPSFLKALTRIYARMIELGNMQQK